MGVADCVENPPVALGSRGGVDAQLYTSGLVSGYRTGIPSNWGEHPGSWQCLGLDPGGTFTVFGVDPVAEDQLLGLSEAVTGGSPLTRKNGLAFSSTQVGRGGGKFWVRELPLLFADEEWVESDMRIRFSRWDTGPFELADLTEQATRRSRVCAKRVYEEIGSGLFFGTESPPARCIDHELQGRLASLPRREVLEVMLPDLAGRVLEVAHYDDGRWTMKPPTGRLSGRYWLGSASGQQYERAEEAPAGGWFGGLRAVPTGSYGPEPTFREQVSAPRKMFIDYIAKGTYDPSVVAEAFGRQSQWLPEGTYQVPQATARFDAAGDPVDPVQLRPTGNPLGYQVQPPQALTTLRAAQTMLGDAPISAIRIRLSGIDRAGEESWQQIEDTVRRIRQTTGLQVLVMAGASPAQVLVELPGIAAADQPSGVQAWHSPNIDLFYDKIAPPGPARTVDGFGWVEEPWLVQGAAVTYLRAGASSHLWLLGVVSVAGLVYLAAAFTSLGLARIPTVAIRRAVGWSRSRVFVTELGRAMMIGLPGAVLGVLTGAAGAHLASLRLDPLLITIAAPAAVVVCGLAALWPAWRVSGIPLAAALSGSEVALSSGLGRRRSSNLQRISAIAVIELWRLRTRTLLALVSGTVAVGAIVTLTSIRDQFAGSLQVTVLGQELLVETGPLQQAGTAVAVALAVLMLAELLWQAVRDRRRELGMLRAIGWGRRHVVWLMVCQGVLLGALAAVLGALSTAGLLASTIAGTQAAIPLLVDTLPWAAGAGILLGAVAAGPPAFAASRIPPADALRTV